MDLGTHIRELRKERGITLLMMSEATDLSIGYLSKVENNLSSPTIAHLHKICEALGITINDILQEESPETKVNVVRMEDRKILFSQNNGGIILQNITEGHSNILGTVQTITDDKVYDSEPHLHDELGILAKGRLEGIAEGKSYYLEPGDTIYIRAGTMHSTHRNSDEECVSYWIKYAAQ